MIQSEEVESLGYVWIVNRWFQEGESTRFNRRLAALDAMKRPAQRNADSQGADSDSEHAPRGPCRKPRLEGVSNRSRVALASRP